MVRTKTFKDLDLSNGSSDNDISLGSVIGDTNDSNSDQADTIGASDSSFDDVNNGTIWSCSPVDNQGSRLVFKFRR